MLAWFTSNEVDPRYGDAFQDEDTRRAFISKVLTILWVSHDIYLYLNSYIIYTSCILNQIQLMITAAITAFFIFNEEANEWIRFQFILALVAMGIFIVVQLLIMCCMSCARTVPVNYILLFLGTFAQSFLVSFLCSRYYTYQVSSSTNQVKVKTESI